MGRCELGNLLQRNRNEEGANRLNPQNRAQMLRSDGSTYLRGIAAKNSSAVKYFSGGLAARSCTSRMNSAFESRSSPGSIGQKLAIG